MRPHSLPLDASGRRFHRYTATATLLAGLPVGWAGRVFATFLSMGAGLNDSTTLMVTHDVDEALYLSDRVICMTDGPAAEVGEIVPVHFPRPRDRRAVLEHPDSYALPEHLIGFLEIRAHRRRGEPVREATVVTA